MPSAESFATTAMGKTEENLGDSVDGIEEGPDPDAILAYLANLDGRLRAVSDAPSRLRHSARPAPVPMRDAAGQPVMVPADGRVRWISEGWKVFNNKGKTVGEYEAFFSDRFGFEFGVEIGQHVCASLMLHGTYSKGCLRPLSDVIHGIRVDTVARDRRFFIRAVLSSWVVAAQLLWAATMVGYYEPSPDLAEMYMLEMALSAL
ncbi:hypothetical protein B0T14DRAFT_567988 [Immersiella caudata]|uniref:Uncharacterized protein n=1 Tax=Immersiella caudata TaxID=314043 RepID=A0AA39WJ73_9PEZI|nr:hypothetical protein B0T14DRAFT_567988 [Immersiella caudata]